MSADAAMPTRLKFLGRVLDRIPIAAPLARTKGWPYVLTWGHRITGLVLVGYALFHVYTLTALTDPAAFDAKMGLFSNPLFIFLEWLLAVPVVLHAFNGGRLMLYELFGVRNDECLIGWVFSLSAVYMALLAVVMIAGTMNVSAGFFWLYVLAVSAAVTVAVYRKVAPVRHSWFWKLQRITAAFMLIMIPAHMILSHTVVPFGHDSAMVIARMQNWFIKLIDISLVLAVAYHCGYGLVSIIRDYVRTKPVRWALIGLTVIVLVGAGYLGVRLAVVI